MTEVRQGHITASDGTRISYALHGTPTAKLPLLCLAGLTRNGRDFEPVVAHFGGERQVLTIDMRGRGGSGWAAPETYRVDIELQDVLAVLSHLSLARVTLLGTSRGGIIGMVIALVQPQFLAGLMLNDVGPRLEPAGLLRIGKYVGASPCYRDWATAARSFAATQDGFSGVSAATWDAVVRRIYVETPEGIRPQHDPALKTTFPDAETIEAGKLPELWDVIPALQQLPVSVLRGANSDLLSPETVERMAGLLPQLDATSVAGRGHVPFLDEPESIAAITRWLSRVDAHEKGPG